MHAERKGSTVYKSTRTGDVMFCCERLKSSDQHVFRGSFVVRQNLFLKQYAAPCFCVFRTLVAQSARRTPYATKTVPPASVSLGQMATAAVRNIIRLNPTTLDEHTPLLWCLRNIRPKTSRKRNYQGIGRSLRLGFKADDGGVRVIV